MTLHTGLITYGLDRPLTGIGRYTLELARALSALKGDVAITLLAASGAGPLAGQSGARTATLPGCRLLPGLMTLGNALIPMQARQLSLDLVHDPTGVTPLLFGAGGARTVVTVHDVFAWSCPGHNRLLDTLIYRYWLPHVLPRVDLIITDSQASRQDIGRYLGLPGTRIRVIPLGISEAYAPVSPGELLTVRATYSLPEQYILFVGSLEKRKNLPHLLEAYARLRQRSAPWPLVIVGARKWKSSPIFDAIQRLGLEPHVHFTGYVADEHLPALYSGADLFVFPSLYEGFGLPVLEAMACGAPVVTSATSSLPEVAGDAALTVDPTDVDALAGAMRRVLTDPDLAAELRQRGLARAATFTWQRTARRTLEVYQELVSVEE